MVRTTYININKNQICITCRFYVISIILMFLVTTSCDKSPSNKGKGNTNSTELHPPKPNFYQPNDYVKWLNNFLAKGKPAGSEIIYDRFWRYRGGEDSMPDPPDDIVKKLYSLSSGPVWISGDYPRIERYFGNINDYLIVFIEAANKPDYSLRVKHDADYPYDASCAVLPRTISSQYAICSLLAKSWMSGPNQVQRMQDAWEIGLKHSIHLMESKNKFLIKRGCENSSIVYRSIRPATNCKIIGSNEIEKTLNLLAQYELIPRRMSDVLYSEWPAALGMIQNLYSKEELNTNYAKMFMFIDRESLKVRPIDIESLKRFNLSPNKIVEEIDEYYSNYINIVSVPLSINVIEKAKGLEDIQKKKPIGRYPFYNTLFPPLSELLARELNTISEFRATCMILLLHKFYYDNGYWPNSLSELEISKHQEYSIDPFSNKEFRYQTKDDSFILYSLGEDGKDDKGQDGDLIFWPFIDKN